MDMPDPSDKAALLASAIAEIATEEVSQPQMAAGVHTLLVTGGDTDRRQSRKANPSAYSTSNLQTRKELLLVNKSAAQLHDALKQLHAPASAAFRDLASVRRGVRTIEIIAAYAAEQADDLVASTETVPMTMSPPEMLAMKAAYVFLTMRREAPTIRNQEGQKAYGPFLDFLEKVFEIRGVTASPENCAKVALQSMERTQSKF